MSSMISQAIKENVRAVLLSKTDGSGVLVSTFLRDYKSFISEPLMYKNIGFSTLEDFLKDIPDVCRLEYSDKHMAYKLYGIAKPNTYVSSFVKRAAEGAEEKEDRKRNHRAGGGRKEKEDRFTPSSNLDEDWSPNHRGLYSLCFPTSTDNGLETKENVALKFTQLGEVAEINMITKLTFVRYKEQSAAKMAIKLWGRELRLRRAEERLGTKDGNTKENNSNSSSNQDKSHNKRWEDSGPKLHNGDRSKGRHSGNESGTEGKWGKPKPESSNKQKDSILASPVSPADNNHRSKSDKPVQVYVGNWPNTADEVELRSLVQPFGNIGCRIKTSKELQNKQYAFVDFRCVEDARPMIEKLNGYVFKSRTLQVRFANKALESSQMNGDQRDNRSGQGPAIQHVPAQVGSVEKEFEGLTIHRSQAPGSYASKNSPISRTINNTAVSPKTKPLSPLYNDSSPLKMPPLEKFHSPEMPKLERVPVSYSRDEDLPDEMPALEIMTSPSSVPAEGSNVQLFVGNFPYGTAERDLYRLFASYGVQHISIMNQSQTNRSTYAFATFSDLQQAQMAILTLDQSLFKGRRLCVTMATPAAQQGLQSPQSNSQTASHLARITCTVGGDSGRTVNVEDTSLSQVSPISMSNISVMSSQGNMSNIMTYTKSSSGFNFKRLTTTLKDYSMIVERLRGEDDFLFLPGIILKVLITHVENDKFFWGQVLMDSQRGMCKNLQTLQRVTLELQAEESRTKVMSGMGRCSAMFEGEWYRGWCSHLKELDGVEMGDVFYLDYGNKATIPKHELYHTKSDFWNIAPVAKPFKLTELQAELSNLTNKVVQLVVVDAGTFQTNYLTTAQIKFEQ